MGLQACRGAIDYLEKRPGVDRRGRTNASTECEDFDFGPLPGYLPPTLKFASTYINSKKYNFYYSLYIEGVPMGGGQMDAQVLKISTFKKRPGGGKGGGEYKWTHRC